MTAKRFNRVGGYVYDGDKCISHFEDVTHRDDIVTLLNELHEENIMLKGEVAHYKLLLMSLEKEAKRISQIR